jgi:hypothetical protein
VIKISISLCQASKQSSWKKVFVEKILKSDKKKLNKKLSRKEKNVENVSQVFLIAKKKYFQGVAGINEIFLVNFRYFV